MTTLVDEMTTGPLAAELAPFITNGDVASIESIIAILNRRDIPIHTTLLAHDVRKYLHLMGLLIPIEESSAMSCKDAAKALQIFPIFDLSNQLIYNRFVQVLDGLVIETLIPDFTETDKAVILGMATVNTSRAEIINIVVDYTKVHDEIWNSDGTRKLGS
jgi:hypothetical protein